MKIHDGKRAVVTGGGQGIGRGIIERLLKEGARVIAADIDEEAGTDLLSELGPLGELQLVLCDVSFDENVRRLKTEAERMFGGLDYLVNNAGIVFEKPFDETTVADWNRIIGVNLTGPYLCSKILAPLLREGGGAIVNIASTRALMSESGNEPYAASKGGVIALTHALAMSLGPEVRVNCVSPGWIDVSEYKKKSRRHASRLTAEDHAQHPAGRAGNPDDIARLVSFLLDPRNGFITGANYIIDGGMTRKMFYI